MIIPLCLEKFRWVPVAMVGVLKAGAAFVPVDASHPQQPLQQVCQDVHAPLVLCSKQTSITAANLGPRWMEIDSTQLPHQTVVECGLPDVKVTPQNAAYATVTTSGSMGKSKGVEIRHSSIAAVSTHLACAIYGLHAARIPIRAPCLRCQALVIKRQKQIGILTQGLIS